VFFKKTQTVETGKQSVIPTYSCTC